MNTAKANRAMLKKLALFAAAMFGFGFALVPFYKTFCEVTGINNLVERDAVAQNTQVDESRWITVEFDANTRGLPWEFAPLARSVRVHPGQMAQVFYEARNKSDARVTGQAIPSYGPALAARYFKKVECFCFTSQVLNPGEAKKMPVQFVVEPGLPAEVNTITLSYTFFEINSTAVKTEAGNAG